MDLLLGVGVAAAIGTALTSVAKLGTFIRNKKRNTVLVLGPERSGKTSLIHRITGDRFNVVESTSGLSYNTLVSYGQTNISFIDCGEIDMETLQKSLNEASAISILVVLDPQQKEGNDIWLRDWLKSLRLKTGSALDSNVFEHDMNVMVFLNSKTSDNLDPKIVKSIVAALSEYFPSSTLDVFHGSVKDNRGVKELLDILSASSV